MTWGEFKQAVADAGVKDDEELWYIDVDFDPTGGIEVARHGISYAVCVRDA